MSLLSSISVSGVTRVTAAVKPRKYKQNNYKVNLGLVAMVTCEHALLYKYVNYAGEH